MTGTFGGQALVGEIDKHKIGKGNVGALTSRIKALYLELIKNAS